MNKRLDNCIYILLKLARDKGFERLIKIEKGKNIARLNVIRERHKSSLKFSIDTVTETEKNSSWDVMSKDGTLTYTVSFLSNTCSEQCQIRCRDCDICVHNYTCNCADALIHYTICKHIHLVARIATNLVKQDENGDETPHPSVETVHHNLKDESKGCDVETLKIDL